MAETNTVPVSPGSAQPGSEGSRSRIDVLSFISTYGVFITLVACIVIFSVLDSDFIEIDNLRTQLGLAAPLLMLSLGLTVVLAMGDFDLSIAGNTLGLRGRNRGADCEPRLALGLGGAGWNRLRLGHRGHQRLVGVVRGDALVHHHAGYFPDSAGAWNT